MKVLKKMDLQTVRAHTRPVMSSRLRVRLGAVLVLAALSAACGGSSVRGAAPQGPAGIPVKVQAAQLVSVKDTTDYVATLKSRDSAVIMPQVEGQITEIYVHSGERVINGRVCKPPKLMCA